jgi:hypothetical protein
MGDPVTVCCNNLACSVIGERIYDDKFNSATLLPEHAVKTLRDCRCAVLDRDDHRDINSIVNLRQAVLIPQVLISDRAIIKG